MSDPLLGVPPALLHAVEHRLPEVSGRPLLVGVTGAPGAGKSHLAAELVAALEARGVRTALVPMDGFHLANPVLERLGLRDRKGAPETFDVGGFARLLRLLRDPLSRPVYAPDFDRSIDTAVAGALEVAPGTQVVVTEGNYLLLDHGGWEAIRPLLDLAAYLDAPDEVRRRRLVERHVAGGRSMEAARAWAEQVDGANARLVDRTRARADLVIAPPTPGS